MARTDSSYSSTESALINLTNLVSRLEGNLLSSSEYQQQLLESEFQRERVAANIEYGRTLLLQLEQSLPSVKSQSRKNALHADLARKRQRITALKQCLEGIAIRGATEYTAGDDEASSDNDIFIYTPEESASGDSSPRPGSTHDASEPVCQEAATIVDKVVGSADTTEEEAPSTSTHIQEPSATSIATPAPSKTAPEPPTSLRNRIRSSSTSAPSATTTAISHPTAGPSTSKTQATESALSHSRSEQESLTNSLLSLATQLKSSSQAFQSSLESERGIIDRAVQGLDRNITGMDAAGRRMGMLRRMTEGRGWWGRMLMYAWIFALWVVAVLIVYLGPKLRF